jgi:hypothetical protein
MSTGVPSSRIRHVFGLHDAGNHTLVTVTTGHLVAGLHLAFDSDEDLDHLHHARGQFVTALQFFDLVFETLLQMIDASSNVWKQLRFLPCVFVVLDDNLAPVTTTHFLEIGDLIFSPFLTDVTCFRALLPPTWPTSRSDRRP